jgi:alkanesulfonate monooxygenase SsuD/methylene tetrahydromethanopterin reductase-like flavin-dependent oxidoreductase (luciferase family)
VAARRCTPPNTSRSLTDPLDAGLAKAGRDPADFEVVVGVRVAAGDDVDECRDRIRPAIALYVGGMGARDRNFYNNLVKRYGYEAAAAEIQDHFLEGRREEAAAAVPDELVDEVALVGPIPRIVERLQAWKESRVTEVSLVTTDTEVLEAAVEAVS